MPIRHLGKLGTISPTCWMSRDGPKPPSNAYARPSWLRPTTLMQCSIWRSCCNEKAHMPKPQIIGDGIWPVIAYRNGQHGRGGR